MGSGKRDAFAIMMAIVFILGMLIGWPGIAMLVFPIFLPITDQLGSDRLWLAAVTASMLQTCFMIPPLGFDLFYMPRASCRRRSRSGRSARASSP